nr:DeoR/GlpR family DNA-binding transcription regulator [Arsenicicoccus piscis]
MSPFGRHGKHCRATSDQFYAVVRGVACYCRRVKVERHEAVLVALRTQGMCSVPGLAATLAVSEATVRRDLAELEQQGRLQRVHGGATAVDPMHRPEEPVPFARVVLNAKRQKEAIARRAAALVADGDVVLLDIGTTTMLLARALRGREITVVTSSLAVLDELRHDDHVEVILLGGVVRRSYHSLVGVLTEDALRQVRASIAFLGASGINAAGEFLDTTVVEVPVKRAMMRAADRTVLLADHTKVPGHGTIVVGSLALVDTVVTDDQTDPAALAGLGEGLAEHPVEVLIG